MIDVHLPTTDGREIILTRYTEPEPELRLLIDRMKLALPAQPPPKIAAAALPAQTRPVVKTFSVKALISLTRALEKWPNPRSRVSKDVPVFRKVIPLPTRRQFVGIPEQPVDRADYVGWPRRCLGNSLYLSDSYRCTKSYST